MRHWTAAEDPALDDLQVEWMDAQRAESNRGCDLEQPSLAVDVNGFAVYIMCKYYSVYICSIYIYIYMHAYIICIYVYLYTSKHTYIYICVFT